MSDVTVRTELPRVVHIVDPDTATELVIDRGSRDGVRPGETYLVFGYGPEISDPDTGENLGRLELVRGRGEVVGLEEHRATLRSVEPRWPQGTGRTVRISLDLSLRAGARHQPSREFVPFRNATIGDLAKPV